MRKSRVDHGGAVFAPAIEALRQELVDLESRATETKDLIKRLCTRAGGSDPRSDGTPTAKRKRGRPKTKPNGGGPIKLSPREPARPKVSKATTASNSAAAELAKIVAEIGEKTKAAQIAKQKKDIEGIRTNIAAAMNAERRAGAILRGGMVRRKGKPANRVQRRRWRRAASLTQKQFDQKLERTTKSAIATMGAGAPSRSQPKPRDPAPSRARAKLSNWHHDEAGNLSRTLVAEDEAAAAT